MTIFVFVKVDFIQLLKTVYNVLINVDFVLKEMNVRPVIYNKRDK